MGRKQVFSRETKLGVVSAIRVIAGELENRFNTHQIVTEIKSRYPKLWEEITGRFSDGGKKCGYRYSARSYVASLFKTAGYKRNGSIKSPAGWGNRRVTCYVGTDDAG